MCFFILPCVKELLRLDLLYQRSDFLEFFYMLLSIFFPFQIRPGRYRKKRCPTPQLLGRQEVDASSPLSTPETTFNKKHSWHNCHYMKSRFSGFLYVFPLMFDQICGRQ